MKRIKKFKDFKKRKTILKKASELNYNWIPNFDKNSPAPESQYSIAIKPIKI